MLIAVISLSAAIVVYSTVMILFGNSPKEQIRKRLNSLAEGVELEYIHNAVLTEKKHRKKNRKQKVQRQLISKRFEDSIAMSGIRLSAREFVILWVLLAIGPAVIGSLLGVKLVAISGMCIVGFAIPPIMVQRSRNAKALLFNKQLGEALTIMSNCMRSGYSFQQAMNSIAKEMQPPISTEFARVVREMNYGTSMEDALNNMVERVGNKDLELLVSAVITSAQVGANLSEILDTIAETVTDRIKLREEVRVFSAQGRMSGIIIGVMPVVVILFLMIMNPTYFEEFANDPIGRMMLGLSVVLEAAGFIIINKIVDVKY